GSRPGINSLAMTPTSRPTKIVTSICINHYLVTRTSGRKRHHGQPMLKRGNPCRVQGGAHPPGKTNARVFTRRNGPVRSGFLRRSPPERFLGEFSASRCCRNAEHGNN